MDVVLKDIIIPSLVLFVLDIIYIYLNSDNLRNLVVGIQKSNVKINYISAVLAYIFILSGYYYFVTRPYADVKTAVCLGIFVYGTYTLTNSAFLKDWKTEIVVIDILWGGFLFGATTYISRWINDKLGWIL